MNNQAAETSTKSRLAAIFRLWLGLFALIALPACRYCYCVSDFKNWRERIDASIFDGLLFGLATASGTVLLFLFICWLRSWRNVRRLLVGFAVMVTLWAVFVVEEDWRCKRDWENYKRARIAAHDWHEWDEFIPPPVLDDENVFKAPHIAAAFTKNRLDAFEQGLGKKYSAALTNFMRLHTNDYPAARLIFVLPGEAMPANVDAELSFTNEDFCARIDRLIKSLNVPQCTTPQGLVLFEKIPKTIRVAVHSDHMPDTWEMERASLMIEKIIFDSSREITYRPSHTLASRIKMKDKAAIVPFSFNNNGWLLAEEYLQAGAEREPFYQLVDDALKRPVARMDCDYEVPCEIAIPNFVLLRNLTYELAARAKAHLLIGQPEEAVHDLARIKKLERLSVGHGPMTLVSAMINVAIHGIYADTIAEGFRLGAWQESQMIDLQKQIGDEDIIPPVQLATRMERLAINRSCDRWRKDPEEFVRTMGFVFSRKESLSIEQKMELFAMHVVPTGWYYQNERIYNELMDSAMFTQYDEAARLTHPATAGVFYMRMENLDAKSTWYSPYDCYAKNRLSLLGIPNVARAISSSAEQQTKLNEALIACALERHRLAHGEYPETLAALTPQFLEKIPHDLVGGGPLKYRRTADGKFLLYSIGWDEKDGGGDSKTDWVWSAENRQSGSQDGNNRLDMN